MAVALTRGRTLALALVLAGGCSGPPTPAIPSAAPGPAKRGAAALEPAPAAAEVGEAVVTGPAAGAEVEAEASVAAPPVAVVPVSPAPPADPLAGFVDDTPRCPPERDACFGIHLHVVVDEGAPVRDLAWVSDQLARAEERFGAAIDVGFEVVAVDALPAEQRDIVTRLDRDKLGRPHFSRGVVHVFVVGSLADVDGPGEIRGVHWRDRAATERRWVIVSSIAGSLTLTHELGHFFSLPHSRYPVSLMNKGESPIPWSERAFHPREAQRMKRARAQMVASGALKLRPRPAADAG